MSTNKRILIVAESINIDDSSGTKGRVALIKSLAKAGYALTVLHFTQKEIQLEGIECLAINERKNNFIYLLSRVHRLLNRWFKIDIGDAIDKMFGFSFGFFNDAKSIEDAVDKYNHNEYDMIWTLSKGNSYRSHKAVLELPQWHTKWYAYVHDPFPQQLYPRPYNYVPHGYRQQRLFFMEVTKKAKRIIFPSQLLKEWMQSYYGSIEGKSLIIPHQITTSIENVDAKFPDYFKVEKFNILHAGNLLDLRDPKPIVEAYALFLEQHPEAIETSSLIFLGKPSQYDAYFIKQKNSLPSLYNSEDYVAFNAVYAMQQVASVNVILEAKSEISPFLPGKFPHCVAANRPIIYIGPYYSETKRLLGKEYPYQFDFNEIEEIAKAMISLYQTWMSDPKNLFLNRPDLSDFCTYIHLKSVLNNEKVS
ncbi:glycosyltransferase family 4 protein [Gelidibacter salicanalis]|uniref:Glycosyltransferase family 4 protein n=1 Tax=Gelidibacter salicanalis TaxID=291193 RepID=A0A5C7AJ46_9FLAO|nr:glycosyltransferase [Gelidibacter salicanalis]TXE05842.1 glycosyltransferase family 4 protein [Gelidibacter salicanalis]